MSVIYKDVPGYIGYRVGDDGSVWSRWRANHGMDHPWRRLHAVRRKRTASYATHSIKMGRNGPQLKVHRLVLEAFLGPRPDGHEGCHRDGDTSHNALANLYWGTRAQNAADMIKHRRHYNNKLTALQIKAIRRAQRLRVPMHLIAHLCGVSPRTIERAASRHDVGSSAGGSSRRPPQA